MPLSHEMRALYKRGQHLSLCQRPLPHPGPLEVLVKIVLAGLCRTDLEVISNGIPCLNALIPGHEAAGQIVALGEQVPPGWLQAPVSLHPYQGCGQCDHCRCQQTEHCPETQMLGVDRDGVFAEYICVPLRSCYSLPAHLPWRRAAYVEPLAAALGILKSGIQPGFQGVVLGNNRIAHLSQRVLRAHHIWPLEQPLQSLKPRSLDFVIESGGSQQNILEALPFLKPGGLLILKSRHRQQLDLPWSEIVRHELRVQGLFYGSFEKAIALLAEGQLPVDDLFGESFALEDYAQFLSPENESKKRFLELQPCAASLVP